MRLEAVDGVADRRTTAWRVSARQPHQLPRSDQSLALGASPTVLPSFFILASNALRALFHSFSFRGTWQPPFPLQEFSAGCSPQPPLPLQVFSPRQTCLSSVPGAVFSSGSAARPTSVEPSRTPPNAA